MQVIFVILHIFAAVFFFPALFITIPLHIIAVKLEKKELPAQSPPSVKGDANTSSDSTQKITANSRPFFNAISPEMTNAVLADKPRMVKMLLSDGADTNAIDNVGNTALISAVKFGHSEVVKVLLSFGANPNIRNNNGKTALHYAEKLKDLDIVKILHEDGVKL